MSEMKDEDIIGSFSGIKRIPGKLYKPLLLIFMLGRCWKKCSRLHLFRDIRFPFEMFLEEFNPGKVHPEAAMYAFWFMRSATDIWTVSGDETIKVWKMRRDSRDRPDINDAMYRPLLGGFASNLYFRIINDKALLLEIVLSVLREYFPSSMHLSLLQAVGIPFAIINAKQRKVFKHYNFSCSICEFSGIGSARSIELQVAYIKSPAKNGPRSIENCIAMCTQHRAFFSHGDFTISNNKRIIVSDLFKKRDALGDLLSYEGAEAKFPKSKSARPNHEYLDWHRAMIFNGCQK